MNRLGAGEHGDELLEQIRRVSAFYASPVGSVFAQLLAGSLQDPVSTKWLQARFMDSRRRGIQELWDRAVLRGEVGDDVDPEVAPDLVSGPVMWRLTSGRRPLRPDETEMIVDTVLSGLEALRAQPSTRSSWTRMRADALTA